MCNSMQHPEILIHFSRPTELLLLQIPFPSYPHLPVANRKPTVARSLLGSPGRGWLAPLQQPPRFYTGQCQGSLPPGGGRAHRSHLRCHRHAWHFPMGSRELPGVPLAHGSRAVACESALYQQRVRGGCRSLRCPLGGGMEFGGAGAGAGPPSLPAAPRTSTPASRAPTFQSCDHVYIPRRRIRTLATVLPRPEVGKVPAFPGSPASRDQPAAGPLPRPRARLPLPRCRHRRNIQAARFSLSVLCCH